MKERNFEPTTLVAACPQVPSSTLDTSGEFLWLKDTFKEMGIKCSDIGLFTIVENIAMDGICSLNMADLKWHSDTGTLGQIFDLCNRADSNDVKYLLKHTWVKTNDFVTASHSMVGYTHSTIEAAFNYVKMEIDNHLGFQAPIDTFESVDYGCVTGTEDLSVVIGIDKLNSIVTSYIHAIKDNDGKHSADALAKAIHDFNGLYRAPTDIMLLNSLEHVDFMVGFEAIMFTQLLLGTNISTWDNYHNGTYVPNPQLWSSYVDEITHNINNW